MRNNYLILDFNNILYRSIAVHSDLSYQGIYTGGFYGFISQLISLMNKYEPTSIITCTDSPPYLRLKEYSDYKKRRKKETDLKIISNKQIARMQCETLMDLLGIPLWEIKGLEADDLIYYVCNKIVETADRVIIVSNDDDLNQLFYTFPYIELDRSGKLYTDKKFFEEYSNWTKRDYINYLAIKGTHNGVPGLRGFGEKKTRDIIEKGEVSSYLEEYPELQQYRKIIMLPYMTLSDKIEKTLKFHKKKNVQEAMRMIQNHGIKITPQINNALRRWQTI